MRDDQAMIGSPSPGPDVAGGAPTPSLLRDPFLYGAALVAAIFCAPFLRYLDWLGDEGVVLHAAVRILGGEALYRDFFEFLPPGSFLLVAAWMKVAGTGFAAVRLLATGLIVATAALLYAAARLASGHRGVAALVTLAWIVSLEGGWAVVINHHWFTTAACMASAVALLVAAEGRSRWGPALASGVFAGTAVMVTPTRGVLGSLAVLAVMLTLPGGRARLPAAVAGMVVFPAAMALHLAARGTVMAALDDAVWFPLRHYASIQGVSFGHFARWSDAVSVALLPATAVLTGALLVLERGAPWREPRFRAALALAGAGLLGAFPRPDIAHILYTAPLAWPLAALAVARLLGRLGPRARPLVGATLVVLCLAPRAGEVWTTVRMVTTSDALGTVPTAQGLAVQPSGDAMAALWDLVAEIDTAPQGTAFFFYPYDPMLPYLTARRHVAPLDVMLPGYTTPGQYREVCRRVVGEAQWVVVDLTWTDPRVLQAAFPAMADPEPPERRRFEEAIAAAFDHMVHTVGTFQVRRRGPRAAAALCDAP